MAVQTAPRPTTPAAQARYDEHANKVSNASAQQAMNWKDADESRQQPMVPLQTGEKYVFRAKPGTLRGYSVRIPTLPDDFRTDKQREVLTNRFNKRREAEGEVKYDLDAIRDAVGGDTILFRPIPGNDKRQTSCFYATSHEDTYQFLMRLKRLNKGGWRYIEVEYPTRMVEINGQRFPATNAGLEAAKSVIMAEPAPE